MRYLDEIKLWDFKQKMPRQISYNFENNYWRYLNRTLLIRQFLMTDFCPSFWKSSVCYFFFAKYSWVLAYPSRLELTLKAEKSKNRQNRCHDFDQSATMVSVWSSERNSLPHKYRKVSKYISILGFSENKRIWPKIPVLG